MHRFDECLLRLATLDLTEGVDEDGGVGQEDRRTLVPIGVIGVNPGGWGSRPPQILDWGSSGGRVAGGSWTGREILL